jgi:hypothetical protein
MAATVLGAKVGEGEEEGREREMRRLVCMPQQLPYFVDGVKGMQERDNIMAADIE